MSSWNGLDPGGTEQIWAPGIIIGMLGVIKTHEPCARNDPDSLIYSDLEEMYPHITWRGTDPEKTFRPIFRRTNPLVHLGLVTDVTDSMEVTDIGNALLDEIITITDVFVIAARVHKEKNGIRSFSKFCKAALECPDETIFTLEHIEFGISVKYDEEQKNAAEILSDMEGNKYVCEGARKRRMQNFSKVLIATGAFVKTANGVMLYQRAIAKEIAEQNIEETSDIITEAIEGHSKQNYNMREIDPTKRNVINITGNPDIVINNERRILLLEKANKIHENIVKDIAALILKKGATPKEGTNSFDIAVFGDNEILIEVKSITKNNCKAQLRKGIVQLLEYAWVHRADFVGAPKRVMILSENPIERVGEDYFKFLTQELGFLLFWKQGENYVDHAGKFFEDVLFPTQ